MIIRQASINDFQKVIHISQTTIRTIYPRYYPSGAVQYFCDHHSDDRIHLDIVSGIVYLLENDTDVVGTVTINGNRINRLFVLPQFQHKGYGRAMLDFAEKMVLKHSDTVMIDASFPAKQIYRKRGYQETEYHMIQTDNGDYLCYDVMILSSLENVSRPTRKNVDI